MRNKPDESVVLNTALEELQRLIKHQERVCYVVHFWKPFENLSASGFRFPQIPESPIRARVLHPLVEIRLKHLDSTLDAAKNKVVPKETVFAQDINVSFADLQVKFAKYGLVRVDPLDGGLEEARATVSVFAALMNEVKKTPLQFLPEFFGGVSPVQDLFSPGKSYKGKTAEELISGFEEDAGESALLDNLKASLPLFAQSVAEAHQSALLPVDGILSKSIDQINEGTKKGLDQSDLWISEQFPGFDVASRLNQKQGDSSIDRLADVLSEKFQSTPSTKPVSDEEREAIKQQLRDELAEEAAKLADTPPEDPDASVTLEGNEPEDPDTEPDSTGTDEDETEDSGETGDSNEAPPNGEVEEDEDVDINQCLAITGAGNQCKRSKELNEKGEQELTCELESHAAQRDAIKAEIAGK